MTFRGMIPWLLAFFLFTQAMGLLVAKALLELNVSAFEEPGDVSNAFVLFFYILGVTAVLLILLRIPWLLRIVVKTLEFLAIFAASALVFSIFLPDIPSILLAIVLPVLRFKYPRCFIIRNLAASFAVAGAGGLLGVSMGFIPALLLLVILSLYDFLSVFVTGHMVRLAKALSSYKTTFTYAFPTEVHTFELGTGDVAIPLVFSASLLVYVGPVASVLSVIGGFFGVLLNLLYLRRHLGIVLPALPAISALSLLFVLPYLLLCCPPVFL